MTYKTRIKFANKQWLVIDNIQYNQQKYYYIIEDISQQLEGLNRLEEYEGNFLVEFIYETDKGIYKNVIDQELIEQLLAIVGQKAILKKEDFK